MEKCKYTVEASTRNAQSSCADLHFFNQPELIKCTKMISTVDDFLPYHSVSAVDFLTGFSDPDHEDLTKLL